MDSTNTKEPKTLKHWCSDKKSSQITKGSDDLQPYIRFAEDGEKGAKQDGTLYSVHDPIPEDSVYASPIYLLTERQRDRLEDFESGWEMSEGCIANKLQDRCQADERVLYPILIESDDGDSWGEQIEWIREFTEEYLPVSTHDCKWHHSGSRSVHCHVPLFTTKDGLEHLREVCKDFYGELDETIYSKKRQFRLPGVRHSKTDLPKVSIEPEWEDDRIGQEVLTTDPERPETYADLLREVYGPDVLNDLHDYLWDPTEPDEPKSEPHLWEPGTEKPDGGAKEKWQSYNRHAFSPYALAANGLRSISIVHPKGGAFSKNGETYLPCWIGKAIGCDGRPWYTDGPCPVKLSKHDYQKLSEMGVEEWDDLLIIGGGSRKSRIFQLDSTEENIIWCALHSEQNGGSREETLETIRDCGYEPGSSNRVDPKEPVERESTGPSEAATLQAQAESREIETLTHIQRRKVAIRLLQLRGMEGAVEWFRKQYGDEFKEDITRDNLEGLCDEFDDLPDV